MKSTRRQFFQVFAGGAAVAAVAQPEPAHGSPYRTTSWDDASRGWYGDTPPQVHTTAHPLTRLQEEELVELAMKMRARARASRLEAERLAERSVQLGWELATQYVPKA